MVTVKNLPAGVIVGLGTLVVAGGIVTGVSLIGSGSEANTWYDRQIEQACGPIDWDLGVVDFAEEVPVASYGVMDQMRVYRTSDGEPVALYNNMVPVDPGAADTGYEPVLPVTDCHFEG